MDIKGLDLTEISQRLEKYVANYFKSFTLQAGESLFAESYLLHYDEVKHLIPNQYHHLFNESDKFNGASGFIEVESTSDESIEYVLMLLSDADYSRALFLLVQEQNNLSNTQHDIVLADFLE